MSDSATVARLLQLAEDCEYARVAYISKGAEVAGFGDVFEATKVEAQALQEARAKLRDALRDALESESSEVRRLSDALAQERHAVKQLRAALAPTPPRDLKGEQEALATLGASVREALTDLLDADWMVNHAKPFTPEAEHAHALKSQAIIALAAALRPPPDPPSLTPEIVRASLIQANEYDPAFQPPYGGEFDKEVDALLLALTQRLGTAPPPNPDGLRDDPDADGTDAAHPAWWRGEQAGTGMCVQTIRKILDGQDDGEGVIGYAPLEKLRRDLLALVAKQ